MSRTATCFVALGLCVAMAAACGDDDGGDGGGGSGGQGGTGGSGGSAGSGGSGGVGGTSAGAAGQTNGGSSGAAGADNGGAGGSAGSSAGAAGSGTVDPPDAGPDGSVEGDASTEPPDSGPVVVADSGVNGNCGGFVSGLLTLAPQNNQDVVIARVIFNDDDETATVVLRSVNPFAFGGEQVLCWGPANSQCVEVDDDLTGEQPAGLEVRVTVGVDENNAVSAEEGELLFASETPENVPTVFAYVNWGDHVSVDVDAGGPLGTNEALADVANFWTLGDSIDLDGNNAFFGDGDTAEAAGFDVCTADQF